MRQLRFVRPGDDRDHVVLEVVEGGEQFVLMIDSALRDAVRADLPRLTPMPESVPRITPREIQVRVRAGESPQRLADEHQMPVERVMRFAGPVLEERNRIADEARRARARRNGDGPLVEFGETVDERFAAHGIDPSLVRWDARRREDGQWVVSAIWLGGDAERLAEWTVNLGARQVSPLDDSAADLLSDSPIRPVGVPSETSEYPRPIVAVSPPPAPGVLAFPAMPHAQTGKLPPIDQVFDQERFGVPPGMSTPNSFTAAHAAQLSLHLSDRANSANSAANDAAIDEAIETVTEPEATAGTQLTNLGISRRNEPSPDELAQIGATGDERSHRPRVPSWDDILLGVRRKGE